MLERIEHCNGLGDRPRARRLLMVTPVTGEATLMVTPVTGEATFNGYSRNGLDDF